MNVNEFLPGGIQDRIVDLKRITNVTNKTIAAVKAWNVQFGRTAINRPDNYAPMEGAWVEKKFVREAVKTRHVALNSFLKRGREDFCGRMSK